MVGWPSKIPAIKNPIKGDNIDPATGEAFACVRDKKPFPKRKLKEYFDNNNFKIVNEYGEGLVIKGIGFRDPKMNINELDD